LRWSWPLLRVSLTAAVMAALRERLERGRGRGAEVRVAEMLAIGRDAEATVGAAIA
jgi:hypothetical protein